MSQEENYKFHATFKEYELIAELPSHGVLSQSCLKLKLKGGKKYQ